MTSLALIGLLVLAAVFILSVLAALAKSAAGKRVAGRYELRASILTPAERSFLGVLEGVLPDGTQVLVKIRLADLFAVTRTGDKTRQAGAQNRIAQKHVDFLLVRRSDFAPLAGVELDDRSHERPTRRDRDEFVDALFQSCGLPLVHMKARATYSPAEIQRELVAALAAPPATRAQAAVPPPSNQPIG